MIICPGEADVEIGRRLLESPHAVVISNDSDLLGAYSAVSLVKPKGELFWLYEPSKVFTEKLKWNKQKKILFCCLVENDYSKNIPTLGPSKVFPIVDALQFDDLRDGVKKF